MDSIWLEITRLGEAGLLMPIGALLFIWFLLTSSRLALVWAAAFGLGVLIVIASKVAFLGWGIGIRGLDFTGFSGHTMLAAAIYPSVAWFSLGPRRPKTRAVLMVIALIFAALIGMSRLEVHAHSPSEVVAGYVLGVLVALTFIGFTGPEAKPMIPIWPLVLAFLVSGLIGIGRYAPSHHIIVKLALAASGHTHPYHRDQWLHDPKA